MQTERDSVSCTVPDISIYKQFDGERRRALGALDRVVAGVESCRVNIGMGDYGALTESAAALALSATQLFAHTSVLMALDRRGMSDHDSES